MSGEGARRADSVGSALWRDAGAGIDVVLLRGDATARRRIESELDAAGRPLSLPSRLGWAGVVAPAASWFLGVRDAGGRWLTGVGVEVNRSRALPGHLLLRAERLGEHVPAELRHAVAFALAALARGEPRVLRLNVEVVALSADCRAEWGTHLGAAGLRRLSTVRNYGQTLVVDLRPTEEEILAGFSSKTRRDLRASQKLPIRVEPITDLRHAQRMNALLEETLGRTGGVFRPIDWEPRIALSVAEPERAHLVGLFAPVESGAEELLAFAWAGAHGDHAHYDTAASTRAGGYKVPLAYPLMWDLIRWAKRTGARHFDLGGVSDGTRESGDPLGGISDFKRWFSKEQVVIADEWRLDPRPVRGALAQLISRAAVRLGRS